MKLAILISSLAGVAVSAHESLRGNHLELFTSRVLRQRLPDGGGPCSNDGQCSNNGKCNSGRCRCNDGWGGSDCSIEQCGDVTSCGKHGKCRHDECECDDGWTGDDCDDEIEYNVKLVVAKIDTKTRGGSGCEDDLKKFFDEVDDADKDDKDDLADVTVVRVPTQCGDGKTLQERSIIDRRHRHLDSGDDDEETIVIGVVLVDSSTRGISADGCIENLKAAADDLSDKKKAKDLDKMDGKVVFIEAGDKCSSANARAFLDD